MSVSLHVLDTDQRFTWPEDDPNVEAVRAAEVFERAQAQGQTIAIRHADGTYGHLAKGDAFPALQVGEEIVVLPQVAGG